MALLEIFCAPNERLRHVAQPIDGVDRGVRKVLTDLLETMFDAQGCGLAATQCGFDMRLVVIDFPAVGETPHRLLKMINPRITQLSPELEEDIEACLSVPGFQERVVRPRALTVEYYDENAQLCTLDAEGYLAKCIQHELDHLNGVLYIDHLGVIRRRLMLRSLKGSKQQQGLD